MIRTAKGPLVTLPYTVEINDITMMIVQHHESEHLFPPRQGPVRPALCGRRQAAEDHGARDPPYVSGQPHRIKYLEAIYDYVKGFEGVLHWNGAEILDWYAGLAGAKLGAAAE